MPLVFAAEGIDFLLLNDGTDFLLTDGTTLILNASIIGTRLHPWDFIEDKGPIGFAWNQFGTELKNAPILFPEQRSGQGFVFTGTDLFIHFHDTVVHLFGLSLSGGGAISLGSLDTSVDQWGVLAGGGGAWTVWVQDLEVDQFDVVLVGGNGLLLTGGTHLLLTDGTKLQLENI